MQMNTFFSMESCLERTAYAILFHHKEYSLDYIFSTFFPTDISKEQATLLLRDDDRFKVTETEEGCYVGRTKITSKDLHIQRIVEEWKDQISSYFREYNCDVKLGMLSQIIKRPDEIPKHLKLSDILHTDLQRRFLLITSPPSKKGDDVVVKYKHTPEEVEYYHEMWRQNVIVFLLQQSSAIPLVTVGTHVTKPKNLGKNQKLIDVIKLDSSPRQRFLLQMDPSHNSLTRLSLTREHCCELWRRQIHKLWVSSETKLLMDLDLRPAPRPAPLPRSVSLSDVIVGDPQQRFRSAADYPRLCQLQQQHQQQQQQQQQQQPNNKMKYMNRQRPLQDSVQRHYFNPQQQQPHHHHLIRNSYTQLPSTQFSRSSAQVTRDPYYYPAHEQPHRPRGSSPPRSNWSPTPPAASYLDYPSPAYSTSLPPPSTSHHPRRVNTTPVHSNNFDHCDPLPLEKTMSSEFSDFLTPPNFFDFLNEGGDGSSDNRGHLISGAGSTQSTHSGPPRVERTVSTEFPEYSNSLPGLWRLLSDGASEVCSL